MRRLRKTIDDYVESTGRNLLEPMNRWREVSHMVRGLTGDHSPLQSFNFIDKTTGEHARIDAMWLERAALDSFRSKSVKSSGWGIWPEKLQSTEDNTGAAYIIDDLVDAIMNAYVVTSKDRRAGERRSGIPRREEEALSALRFAALVCLIVTINAWNAIGVSTRAWAPGSHQP